MSRKQRSMLLVGLVIIAALGVVPPWKESWEPHPWSRGAGGGVFGTAGSGVIPGGAEDRGYHLISSPPERQHKYNGTLDGTVRVDYGRLLVSWAVVGGLTGAAALALKGKE